MASDPGSAASPSAAAAAVTDEVTPPLGRKTPHMLTEEKEMEAMRRAPARGDEERGLALGGAGRRGYNLVIRVDSIACSDFSVSPVVRDRDRRAYPITVRTVYPLFERKGRHGDDDMES